MPRLRVCDAAVLVLRETNNPAVMWGDCGLLDRIAERAGMARKADAWMFTARDRCVRIFWLPEHAPPRR